MDENKQENAKDPIDFNAWGVRLLSVGATWQENNFDEATGVAAAEDYLRMFTKALLQGSDHQREKFTKDNFMDGVKDIINLCRNEFYEESKLKAEELYNDFRGAILVIEEECDRYRHALICAVGWGSDNEEDISKYELKISKLAFNTLYPGNLLFKENNK